MFWKIFFHFCFGYLHALSEAAVRWALHWLDFVRTWRYPASHNCVEAFSKSHLLAWKRCYNLQIKTWCHLLPVVPLGYCVISVWRHVYYVERRFEVRKRQQVVESQAPSNRTAFLFNIARRSDRQRRIDCVCCWQVSHEEDWSSIGQVLAERVLTATDGTGCRYTSSLSLLLSPSLSFHLHSPSFIFSFFFSWYLCLFLTHVTDFLPLRNRGPYGSLLTYIFNPY